MRTNDEIYDTTTVTIGNIIWNVRLVARENPHMFGRAEITDETTVDDGAYGITYFETSEIYIARGLSPQLLRRTITHELTHAALFTYNYCVREAEVIDEQVCEFMENALDQIYNNTEKIYKEFQK